LIMRARVVMGWVEAPPEPEYEEPPVEETDIFAQAQMEGEQRDA
jgi:N utilization substance protein A